MKPQRFTILYDDFGYWYFVPVEKKAEFQYWAGDPDYNELPKYAVRVDGKFSFENPIVE